MSSHTPTSYDVNSCHRHVIGIHIYHMNSSSIIWQFPLLLEQCLESIWVPSGVSSTCVYQMVWWWYRSLYFCCQAQMCSKYCILTSSLVKKLYLERLRKMSVIIGNGYCFRHLTLFSWGELLIQHTLLSSFESLFMWINIKSFIKHLSVFLSPCWSDENPI